MGVCTIRASASARINHIDVSAARSIPGVAAVSTHLDIPGENSYFYSDPPDQPLLISEFARFQGDAVAAIAAVDDRCAQQALDAIRVDYSPLPGVYDPLDAMGPGSRRVWPQKDNICDHLVIVARRH